MKLIVASNSLPLKITRTEDGFDYGKSCGGLVAGIESLAAHMSFIWVGCLGDTEFSKEEQPKIVADCWDQFRCVPVFLPAQVYEGFYNRFSNEILWPALHSFPDDVCFTYSGYAAYKESNEKFAEIILERAEDGDIIWVHDYHLTLLPAILREKNKTLRIMFFFHTAFPDESNMERILYKDEILKSICSCDLVAFHIPEYALNFKKAALDIPTNTIVKAISIGTDPERFRNELKKPETQKMLQQFRERFKDKKIVLGVDRTDYIKGIPHKMKGFGRFLSRNPEMENNVVLLQIGIPSRLGVQETASYVAKISEMVTKVNGSVGSIVNTPIHMLLKSVSFSELVALYAVSDVLLVTSVMDGLNLVALEYISSQDANDPGVVVLSKFAGAITSLQGAVEHNPNNTEEVAEALEKALSLSPEERRSRHEKNVRNVDLFTSVKWAKDNLDRIYPEWKHALEHDH